MDFKNQIDALNDSYECNLKSFRHYYILTKMYPSDSQYKKDYDNARSNLVKLSKNLFLVNNQIQTSLDEFSATSTTLNKTIGLSETEKASLQTKIGNVDGEIGGARQLAQDFKTLYTEQYLSNLAMILGVGISSVVLYSTYKKDA